MSGENVEHIEQQLAGLKPAGAPRALRAAVLADVQRELRASRWDRRLVRAAAVLLIIGVGMNAAIGFRSARDGRPAHLVAESGARQSLVETAVVVAEATDARTGSRYARQLAAMIGHALTEDEAAAIDAAVHLSPTPRTNGNKG